MIDPISNVFGNYDVKVEPKPQPEKGTAENPITLDDLRKGMAAVAVPAVRLA